MTEAREKILRELGSAKTSLLICMINSKDVPEMDYVDEMQGIFDELDRLEETLVFNWSKIERLINYRKKLINTVEQLTNP